jgi:hypothetical protein
VSALLPLMRVSKCPSGSNAAKTAPVSSNIGRWIASRGLELLEPANEILRVIGTYDDPSKQAPRRVQHNKSTEQSIRCAFVEVVPSINERKLPRVDDLIQRYRTQSNCTKQRKPKPIRLKPVIADESQTELDEQY